VLVTTGRDIRTVGLAARRRGIPVIWRMGPKPQHGLIHRLTGSRVVSRVIAPSHFVARELDSFPWLRGKITVIHNGISPVTALNDEQIAEKRHRWGYGPEHFVILYVGRLLAGKGVSVLLRSFESIKRRFPQARLAIVGTGPDELELRDLARVLNIDQSVAFQGYAPDPSAYFAACDLFVLPSRYESFSYVLLEAMAHGKPCIATKTGAIPEVVQDAAVLVPPDDPYALAESLDKMIGDPSYRDAYAQAGRRHVLEHFTLDDCVKNVETLLHEVIGA
jgi:glycosyltransferase involved in cell wall biosynthesis